jgi:transcriptional activator SPT8
MNGKASLTQVQRHHHVDSVTLAGVLSSWWENEEIPGECLNHCNCKVTDFFFFFFFFFWLVEQTVKPDPLEEPSSNLMPPPPVVPKEPKLSSVYSLDIHSEALWAVQGCENGSINLTTVRHEEGKCHHVLRKHTAPVSVLMITPDETGVISGSWDKSVLEWDLNIGATVRSYDGHSSQLSSAEFQPMYSPYVPDEPTEEPLWNNKNPNTMLTTSIDGQCLLWDRREPTESARRLTVPERTPPWCLSVSILQKNVAFLLTCIYYIQTGLLECRWI